MASLHVLAEPEHHPEATDWAARAAAAGPGIGTSCRCSHRCGPASGAGSSSPVRDRPRRTWTRSWPASRRCRWRTSSASPRPECSAPAPNPCRRPTSCAPGPARRKTTYAVACAARTPAASWHDSLIEAPTDYAGPAAGSAASRRHRVLRRGLALPPTRAGAPRAEVRRRLTAFPPVDVITGLLPTAARVGPGKRVRLDKLQTDEVKVAPRPLVLVPSARVWPHLTVKDDPRLRGGAVRGSRHRPCRAVDAPGPARPALGAGLAGPDGAVPSSAGRADHHLRARRTPWIERAAGLPDSATCATRAWFARLGTASWCGTGSRRTSSGGWARTSSPRSRAETRPGGSTGNARFRSPCARRPRPAQRSSRTPRSHIP